MRQAISSAALHTLLLAAGASALSAGTVHAASADPELLRRIDQLQQELDQLKASIAQGAQTPPPGIAAAPGTAAAVTAAAGSTAAVTAPAVTAPAAPAAHDYFERKPGPGVTLLTRGGELTAYGNLDVSADVGTKGISSLTSGGVGPVGNGGWMPDISTNIAFFGLRGFQSLGDFPTKFVWQLETQIDISTTSGTSGSNSNTSDVVKGGLTSRNSFIGVSSPAWGAVKIGKTDAPYKNSTASMNPFFGTWGDYGVIMGNTGGDNRVEFGTRLDHAIWYESPVWGGFNLNVLVSPGQNRGYDDSNLAAGEVDCTGGNVPGSGGLAVACNDGSFGTAYSASLGYREGGLYLLGAAELHKKVNRTSDLPTWLAADVADESAAKFGAQYHFSSGTTVNGIVEKMKRNLPADLEYQDERSRSGYWLEVSQQLTAADSLHLGWAHANKTPGDPGQHNTPGGLDPDNSANLFTLLLRHQITANFSVYGDYAETINGPAAHYDLGAGGRTVTTDCHDASNPDTSGFDPNGGAPHCWAGGRLQGVSAGMKYTF